MTVETQNERLLNVAATLLAGMLRDGSPDDDVVGRVEFAITAARRLVEKVDDRAVDGT